MEVNLIISNNKNSCELYINKITNNEIIMNKLLNSDNSNLNDWYTKIKNKIFYNVSYKLQAISEKDCINYLPTEYLQDEDINYYIFGIYTKELLNYTILILKDFNDFNIKIIDLRE